MATTLTSTFASLNISSLNKSPCPCNRPRPVAFQRSAAVRLGFSASVRGTGLSVRRAPAALSQGSFEVLAKQNAKKRTRQNEKRRLYNRGWKLVVKQSIKKVLRTADALKGNVKTEEEVQPLEELISKAYQAIDKAVGKGVLHQNTGARRKSRLAATKRLLLIEAGLYSPSVAAA